MTGRQSTRRALGEGRGGGGRREIHHLFYKAAKRRIVTRAPEYFTRLTSRRSPVFYLCPPVRTRVVGVGVTLWRTNVQRREGLAPEASSLEGAVSDQ